MKWSLVLVLLAVSAGPAMAGELFVLGGATKDTGNSHQSFGYQTEYREGLAENLAVSASYLNEGHVPNHHRDGLAPLMLWGRANLVDRRLSLAVGAGPYIFADTMTTTTPVRNMHGVGGILGGSATWYLDSRLLFQVRANWTVTSNNIDTVTLLAGIGYQLDPPPVPGPLPKPPSQREKTTSNEVTVYAGQTVVNNPGSSRSLAVCAEYRRGLLPYLDVTASWLNEENDRLTRRNGLVSQAWLVRDFMGDHLALGVGGGVYLAVDRRSPTVPTDGSSSFVSGIISATASMRNFSFDPNLTARLTMNRIVTNYDRDTDMFLLGVGYRF